MSSVNSFMKQNLYVSVSSHSLWALPPKYFIFPKNGYNDSADFQ